MTQVHVKYHTASISITYLAYNWINLQTISSIYPSK